MKGIANIEEFKPALRFLLIFVGVYVAGNILYGSYVEYYKPRPDPATVLVTKQTEWLLGLLNQPAQSKVDASSPYVLLVKDDRTVLRVFEGCNGLNVLIIFASFILAFGGHARSMLPYLCFGVLIIHTANLARLLLLFYTALYRPMFFYYFHKYFFTAVLYLVVFALWIVWMRLKLKLRAAHA